MDRIGADGAIVVGGRLVGRRRVGKEIGRKIFGARLGAPTVVGEVVAVVAVGLMDGAALGLGPSEWLWELL